MWIFSNSELPTDGQMFDDITNPQPSTSGLQNKPSNPLTLQTTNADRPGASAHKSSSIVSPPSMLPADNPGFMSEFYGNSRLHHISHWRTHLKDVVCCICIGLFLWPGKVFGKLVLMPPATVACQTSPHKFQQFDF